MIYVYLFCKQDVEDSDSEIIKKMGAVAETTDFATAFGVHNSKKLKTSPYYLETSAPKEEIDGYTSDDLVYIVDEVGKLSTT